MEGGLSYLGQSQNETLHQQLHKHTRPLVHPKNVFGISERLGGGCYQGNIHLAPGAELIPVNEKQVVKAVNEMIDRGCEVIGILFLFSFVDARHEHEAKAIAERVLKERGLSLPVVCSADVAPVSKENNRLKSLLFQCFAAEQRKRDRRKECRHRCADRARQGLVDRKVDQLAKAHQVRAQQQPRRAWPMQQKV
jgi:N-methylhydantoinase A